ncbi:LysR family transcriptional regulator [Aidingimonas halophila]|uniref:Transcriptional regulator, LysR family n=1 Tax=Aidingimonas halophila TaxID=574349 RepID=A0A1H3EHJ7_9GAMM|nr:LysR family transcriptional regulator [Aidingimonas halophila]GHC33478.1 HTH-type transcriptional activator BauR [Aidingimonas halophila]SDX77409.1 transcriptional regulator, LysR family [Aidingimonas halophila]
MKLAAADLKSLAVFLAVAEHRGFAGAQTALHMSQSAISFHIRAIEERVGFTVCQRGRQGFELTERGAIAYERAKALLADVDDFDSEMSELRSTVYGTLRLGVVDNTIMNEELQLQDVIGEFLRKNHKVRINVMVGSPDYLIGEIANGDIQAGILPETTQMEGLQHRQIYTEMHSVYCGARHPLFGQPDSALNAGEISRYPFVVRPYANLQELQAFPGAQVGAHASNMEAQALLILSGHFIGNLPTHYAAHWVARGELRPLMADSIRIPSPFCIVTRAGRRPSLMVRNFIQELVSQLWQHAHGNEGDDASAVD